jgi:hypothetical protein
MFQDWTSERLGGVQELIKASVAMEARVTLTDLEQAMRRDLEYNQRPLAPRNPEKLGSPGMYVPRSEIDVSFHDAVGSLFVDGVIQIEGRLCDHFGGQSWLILHSPVDDRNNMTALSSDIVSLFSVLMNGKIVSIGRKEICDMTDVFSTWFLTYGARAVLLRPDHYVYGIAKTTAELEHLVRKTIRHIGLYDEEETVTIARS